MGLYGSAPAAPDPEKTAAAQTATNVSTAVANSWLGNINQVTPDGTLNYSKTGSQQVWDPNMNDGKGGYYDIPTFTATQTLSDAQQAIKNQEDAASLNMATLAKTGSGNLNSILSKSLDTSNAPAASNPSQMGLPNYTSYSGGPALQTSVAGAGDIAKSYDVNFDTSAYQNAILDRINPQLQADQAALETRLANQGLQPGTEAYDRAMAQNGQQRNDAYIAAYLNAGQEQSRLAGLANQQAAFQNAAQAQQYSQNANDAAFANSANQQIWQNQNTTTSANNALADQSFNAERAKNSDMDAARSKYLNELYANRNQGINEVTALMSGGQVTSPNFVSTQGQTMPTVDYAGLVNQDYQNKLAAYNADQSGIGSILGGLAGLFTLSDRRAKRDVRKLGTVTPKGGKTMGLYEYSYKAGADDGRRHVGVMAQEAEKAKPSAVKTGADGLKRVNYGKLFEAGK